MTPSAKAALLAGAAVTAGVAARRRRSSASFEPGTRPAPPAPAPGSRDRTVVTEDGVELAVVECGARQAATATVLLAHGYVQSSTLWDGQVRDLVGARPDLRVVSYDHRGHGRSGRTTREAATLDQLARDMRAVIDAVAPEGPVVVAGHSMGGMTIMALAEQFPELFGDRVAGVAFVASSSGQMDAVTHGLPAPLARIVKRSLPRLTELAVRAESRGRPRPVGVLDARLVFPRGVDRTLVQSVLEVHRGTPAETVAAFLPTFSAHDRLQVLEALAHVPSVVIGGDRDLTCPIGHSLAIADALDQCELTVFPGVGHMVHLERRAEVSRILLGLVDRAVPARPRPLTVV